MLKRRRRQLELLSNDEIEQMREVGQLSATLLKKLGGMLEPGMTTQDLDDEAVAFAEKHGVSHAPFNYKGFPRSICTSVNVHLARTTTAAIRSGFASAGSGFRPCPSRLRICPKCGSDSLFRSSTARI